MSLSRGRRATRSLQAIICTALFACVVGHSVAIDSMPSRHSDAASVRPVSSEKRAWISAISNDNTDQLSTLLNQYDPEMLLPLTAPNGKTALMVACKVGDLSLAKLLVGLGANVHEKTQTNGTAFMFAVLGDSRAVAQWLVKEGADIHVVGSNGWTALTIAAAKGNYDLLRWLIDLGADAQVRDVYRFTPLLRAVDNGHGNVVALLLSLGDTDVNARDEYDNTALHHAVSTRNKTMVRLLLDHEANPHLVNRDGISVFELADGISDLEMLLNSANPISHRNP